MDDTRELAEGQMDAFDVSASGISPWKKHFKIVAWLSYRSKG
jgi:hypothetical protein